MKNKDKLLLIVICLSMLMVTANSAVKEAVIGQATVNLGNASGSLAGETISVGEAVATEESNKQSSDIMTDEYETSNGMILTLGKNINYEATEKSKLISLSIDNKILDFDISIDPYGLWNYAKVDGILIVPMQAAKIDPYGTSYYPSGDELVIKLSSDALHELQIYTGSKGAPSIIIPKMSINWNYDASKRIVKIKSNDVITGDIVMFWAGFSGNDETIFLEDMQKIENLAHNIGVISKEKINLNKDVAIGEEKLNKLESDLDELQLHINATSKANDALANQSLETNSTLSKLENMVTGNIAVAPSLTIVWIIISIILVILLIDAFLFKPKEVVEK